MYCAVCAHLRVYVLYCFMDVEMWKWNVVVCFVWVLSVVVVFSERDSFCLLVCCVVVDVLW